MAPEDGEAFTKLIEKNPKLGEGWLRQADYDRGLNKAKDEVAAANAKAQEWIDWGGKNKPRHEQLLKDYTSLETTSKTKISELEKQVQDATAAAARAAENAGGEVNVEQVNAIAQQKVDALISAKGYATQSDIDRITGEVVQKSVDERLGKAREEFLTQTFPAATQFMADLNDIMGDHRAEFGEKLNRAEFSKYMQDNKLTDPNKAYEQWVGPRRTEITIKKKVEEGVAAEISKRNIPGVSSASSPDLGPLQIRLSKTADPLSGKDVELGDNQAGMAAAAELRSEGKL